jgi:FkbM family methyltransferase
MLKRSLFALWSRVFSLLFGSALARQLWRLPGSRALYQTIMTRLTPAEVEVDGHRFRLDETDSLLLSVRGDYEPVERRLFAACIEAGDVVLDIGGHIGLYTLTAARAVGPAGRVVTIEPSGDNFALLEHNVAANGYADRVTLHCAAAAESEGTAVFSISETNSGDNFLVDGGAGVVVPTVAVDDLFADARRVDVVKLDIQGGEPGALAGARATIRVNSDVVVFTEVSPPHLSGGAEPYLHTLEELGFDVFVLVDEEAPSIRTVTVAELVETCRRAAGAEVFYLNLVGAKGPEGARRLRAAADLALATPTR